jgi:hypothetical protein
VCESNPTRPLDIPVALNIQCLAQGHAGETSAEGRRAVVSSLCESRSCSVLTVSGAPVGREEVDAWVILLEVGLATPLYA